MKLGKSKKIAAPDSASSPTSVSLRLAGVEVVDHPQVLFVKWQRAAGFDRIYNFHALRHTAITNVYRATRDLYLTQRFTRHAGPLTTTAYTHPSDE